MVGSVLEGRESDIVHTMVRLADTLVSGYDEQELLHDLADSCVRIFDGAAAGVSLGVGDRLEFIVATSDEMGVMELLQMERQEGPCTDAYRSGRTVHTSHISGEHERWPHWAPKASALGFHSAEAFPMRLRDRTIGALNVYATTSRPLSEDDVAVGRALADMATIGILHERSVTERDVVATQLQHALDSRVVIEQAKGMLADRHGIGLSDAFERLRNHARSTQTRLAVVAGRVVGHELDL
jgi:hypothetical protein